jgi:peroxiredoxin
MKTWITASSLVALLLVAAAGAALVRSRQRPRRPVTGLVQRSKVDASGHSRGIVQVDLMRRIVAGSSRRAPLPSAFPAPPVHRVASQAHPLLGRPAPPLVLRDVRGETWNLASAASDGSVVVVFHLGFTCMACVTHLVELDIAAPRFRARQARVLAVSADAPEFAGQRIRNFGSIQLPLLSDPNHAVSLVYGVWKPVPGGDPDDGDALHGTFIVDRDGLVCWAYVGDRPFQDIEVLLAELDSHAMEAERVTAIR